MHAGVGQQVGQHLMQPGRVAEDDHRLLGQIELPLMIRTGDVRIADRIDCHPRKVHRFAFQRPPGVQAGQQE